MLAAAYAPSYSIGELVLRKIGGIDLSGRGLNKTAVKIGSEMVAQRDARTEAYFAQPLPRQHAQPKTPIELACVSVDGGRMQTRDEGGGKGVHHPHWRENKNALFLRMKSGCFADDPHPDLPACFANRERMKKLLSGVGEGQYAARRGRGNCFFRRHRRGTRRKRMASRAVSSALASVHWRTAMPSGV